MAIDADRLTELLAERFSAVVPAGIQVTADGGMLWYASDRDRGRAGSHIRGATEAEAFGRSDAGTAAGVAALALDHLQDFVSEATAEPWPGTTRQPPPGAEVRGAALHLWYGEPDAVVLTLAPISLAEVVR